MRAPRQHAMDGSHDVAELRVDDVYFPGTIARSLRQAGWDVSEPDVELDDDRGTVTTSFATMPRVTLKLEALSAQRPSNLRWQYREVLPNEHPQRRDEFRNRLVDS